MKKPSPKPGKQELFGLDAFERPVDDSPGISLDQLSAAFAEMLSSGDDPYVGTAAEQDETDERSGDSELVDSVGPPSPDNCEITPRTILEAMLFVGSPTNEPLSSQQVASLMRGVRPAEIDQLVAALNESYRERACPYEIRSEGAGYRLVLRPEFHRVRDRFYGKVRQARLSQAAIEVLSLVAYNQPLSADEITRFRGASSGAILNQLVRRELLRLDRSDPDHRRGRYFTTSKFLRLFGLESLEELPQSAELANSS